MAGPPSMPMLGPLPMGPPLVLPPPLSPAEERALAQDLGNRFRNAGDRLDAVGGEVADGRIGAALRDTFVPSFFSGHRWADTLVPDTRPMPGTDGVAVGRMSGMPEVGYAVNTGMREVSVFGRSELGQATTPPLLLQADVEGVLRGSDGQAAGLLHDDGSFELLRGPLGALAGVVEWEGPTYQETGPRASPEVSSRAAAMPPDPDWDPDEVPRQDPAASDRLGNAMRSYRTSEYQVDNLTVRLDGGSTGRFGTGMRHIMERHVPETWNGSVRGVQTFFARGTTPADVQRMVGEVVQQNRGYLIQNIGRRSVEVVGRTAEGANVTVRIVQGRVVSAYPSVPRLPQPPLP